MTKKLVTCRFARHSAFYEPLSVELKTVVRTTGAPSMLDRRRHALAVPRPWTSRVDEALFAAGYTVELTFEGVA